MAFVNLMFEQYKWILKCYLKTENVTDAQRRWRNEFGTQPPTRVMVTKIRDEFEVAGTVDKGQSTVKRMMKLLLQCHMPAHNLQAGL
jgi:hypothetical protein